MKWKRLAVGLVSFAFGALVIFTYRNYRNAWAASTPVASQQRIIEINDAQYVDPEIAKVEYSPRDIVQIQLDALRASRIDPVALETCYSLASPSNRMRTGPFANFAAMVTTPPYDLLGSAEKHLIGEELIRGDIAAILVTCLDKDETPYAFRFVLSKQHIEPYEDCWMTEGVQQEILLVPSQRSATPAVDGSTTEESIEQ